ncbi:MAG: hypothetical protein COB16_18220 [Rhodobacteraceae bacterium]|nr:MAG: hypothetical protein COB16_18220 [Paracoccaceae bacterium]
MLNFLADTISHVKYYIIYDLIMKQRAPEQNAAIQADVLMEADLRSLPSYGLLRLIARTRASRPLDPSRPIAAPGDGMRARRQAAMATGNDLPTSLHSVLGPCWPHDDKHRGI